VDKIVGTLYFFRSNIERFIKNATGFTLWNYINAKTRLKAAELLHSGVSRAGRGKLTGFRNYSTFL
jgi:hypothetical protein